MRVLAAAWAFAIAATLAIGASGPASWRAAIVDSGPGCPFRATTGVNCPFCGMTRATLALGHGDWHAAFALHPLAPLVLIGVLGLLTIVALGRTDALLRGVRPYILLGAIVGVWILRLVLE